MKYRKSIGSLEIAVEQEVLTLHFLCKFVYYEFLSLSMIRDWKTCRFLKRFKTFSFLKIINQCEENVKVLPMFVCLYCAYVFSFLAPLFNLELSNFGIFFLMSLSNFWSFFRSWPFFFKIYHLLVNLKSNYGKTKRDKKMILFAHKLT